MTGTTCFMTSTRIETCGDHSDSATSKRWPPIQVARENIVSSCRRYYVHFNARALGFTLLDGNDFGR